MPLTLEPVAPPTPFDEGLTALVERALRDHTQWTPAYEGDAVAAITGALDRLMTADTLTPEQVNARIEGARAALYLLRGSLEVGGTRYDPAAYQLAP